MRDKVGYERRRVRNQKEWFAKIMALEHGKRSTALAYGCRCEPCTYAMAEYNRRYHLEVEAPKRKGPGELI